MESWKVIYDFPNYEISNYGNVRNNTKIVKAVPNKHGYKLHQRAKQIAMYSICGDLIKTFLSVKDAQRETGLNDSNIVKCCKGIKKTCGGYIWAYV